MCFKENEAISTGMKQTFVDQLTNIGKNISSMSWTDCISHSTNTLGKGMNPFILPPAMGK